MCAWVAGSAVAQAPAPATQLAGTFQMSGRVTVAHLIRGEHVGELVQRTWTFTQMCATAPCATVGLVRSRASGGDTLTLTFLGPGVYAGTGVFYAPLRCAGQIYPTGEVIPFKITVHVTGTTPTPGGVPTVSAIRASYVNTSRANQTPCLALLGHDAARYTGQLASG
jgi:hypothetical protein